jgi:hypothetical protein
VNGFKCLALVGVKLKIKHYLLKTLAVLFAGGLAFTHVAENEGAALSQPDKRGLEQTEPLSQTTIYLPLVFNNYTTLPPSATTSRYMATTNTAILYNEGCSEGTANQNGVIVLDFGQPWVQSATYGVLLFNGQGFRTTTQVKEAAIAFLSGYWDCSSAEANLTLGIGTNNYGAYTTQGSGQAWAQMVNAVDAWIKTPPTYESKLAVAGANDIETWNTVTASRAWVIGYDSVNNRPYYNYGSCDGCPYKNHPEWNPNNNWTKEDFWYVSWGAEPAWPLPEIYNTLGTHAYQWQYLSLYAYTNHGMAMKILGAFTQWQACQGRSCNGIDNTPTAGWSQLSNALNSDSRTAQWVQWSTDIKRDY